MAEAAGLALGVVALAGAFKDCLDLFSYVSPAKSIGRDYEILNIKLDIEKTLLLQWADRVRLLGNDYDNRLDQERFRDAVSNVLASIRMLLGESTKYKGLYGLEALSSGEAGSVVSTMSEHRMATFNEAYDRLQEKIQAKPQGISALSKTRWAIRHREKFTALISELSYFVSKLNDLLPTQDWASRTMMAQDFGFVRSTHDLKMIREASSGHGAIVEAMASQNLIERCQQAILQRIWFRAINDRYDDVAVPHPDTYEWVLQPSKKQRKWDDLRAWMASGSGIYWLSGKAGSGKSTLLKYIQSCPTTTQLLQTWAGEASLTTASFFFWNLGTHHQKSQEGLSRALLYEILDSNRDLIPKILPNMWRERYGNDESIDLPSATELRQAFERVVLTITGRKLFLFIDGLDEYDGNINEGISLLKRLSSNPNIKALTSSRPIVPCFEAFSQCQKASSARLD